LRKDEITDIMQLKDNHRLELQHGLQAELCWLYAWYPCKTYRQQWTFLPLQAIDAGCQVHWRYSPSKASSVDKSTTDPIKRKRNNERYSIITVIITPLIIKNDNKSKSMYSLFLACHPHNTSRFPSLNIWHKMTPSKSNKQAHIETDTLTRQVINNDPTMTMIQHSREDETEINNENLITC